MTHAPPPGSRSGVADYAETLRRVLERLEVPEIDLYHLGNNRLHEAIYARALAKPGVIVLHDAVLHHFFLGTLSRAGYIEEFVYNYGEWRRHMAEELWAERAHSATDPRYFQFPMLRRAVQRARAVIVHNPGAATMARAAVMDNSEAEVHLIPHFYEAEPEPDWAEAAAFRRRIGVEAGTVLFGIFGYLREPKRVLPSIRAFRKLHAARPDTALLLAGDPVSKDLERLLLHEILSHQVLSHQTGDAAIRRMGHLSERDLRTAACAIDCCVNLRYPGAGETSGIAIRMMGAGKPVVVTAGEEFDGIPATACLRVSPGIAESAELFEHMVLVTEFPGVAREIGEQARRHIRERHTLETVAGRYREILCEAASSVSHR
jgi:glycosyltransferase involved in cell wall biosynthesis